MTVLPRQQAFEPMLSTPLIPIDGAFWVVGDHITVDKNRAPWGDFVQYAGGEVGIQDVGASAKAWLAAMPDVGADVEVDVVGYWMLSAGKTKQDTELGCMARLSAITGGSAAGGFDHWFAADAYVFRLLIDAATETATVKLERINAGVVTELASVPGIIVKEARPYKLTLKALGTGASISIVGEIGGVGIISASDTSASRITASGRAGFLSTVGKSGADVTRTGISRFQVRLGLTQTVSLLDDFRRPNRKGDATYYPRSLWHDSALLTMAESAGDGRIEYTANTGLDQLSLYQVRVKGDDYSAEVKATLPDATSVWGLIVRGSRSETGTGTTGLTGYVARVTAAASNNVTISRYLAGVETVLVTRTAAITVGVEFTLRVRTWLVGGETRVQVFVDSIGKNPAVDALSSRLTGPGQVGLIANRASGTLIADDFSLLDDGDSVTIPGSVLPVLGEQYPAPSPPALKFRLGERASGSGADWTLGVTPASDLSAAVWAGGVRMRPVTVAPSSPDEARVTASTKAIKLGFTAAASVDVICDVITDALSPVRLNIDLTSQINGVTDTFTLPEAFTLGTVRLYWRGYELDPKAATPAAGEFQELSTTQVKTGFVPQSGEWLIADCIINGATGSDLPIFNEISTDAAGNGNRTFDVANIADPLRVASVVGGNRMIATTGTPQPDELKASGATMTLGFAPATAPRFHYQPADFSGLDLPLVPSFAIQVEERRPSHRFEFEDRSVQTAPIVTKTRRLWRTKWQNLDKGQRDTLVAFFQARKGQFQQISWTPPDDVSSSLAHITGPVRYAKKQPGVYDVEATLQELITP